MKYLLILTMAFSLNAHALFDDNEQNQKQNQKQNQAQVQGQIAKGGNAKATGVGVGVSDVDVSNRNSNRNTNTNVNANSNKNYNSSYSKSGAVAGSYSKSSNKAKTGDITIVEEAEEIPASSAAAVITAACQTGISAQGHKGGFGVTNTDQFCDYLKMAAVYETMYLRAIEGGDVCFKSADEDTLICPDSGKAQHAFDRFDYFVTKADNLLSNTAITATAERASSQILKPATLIGLLVFLL